MKNNEGSIKNDKGSIEIIIANRGRESYELTPVRSEQKVIYMKTLALTLGHMGVIWALYGLK